MHLRAAVVCALAAVLALASPAAALGDITQGHPTSSYARNADTVAPIDPCAGTNWMPIEFVFQGFTTPATAESQMDTQMGIHDHVWSDTLPTLKELNMDGPAFGTGDVQCRQDQAGRNSNPASDAEFRTLLRLWAYPSPPNGGPFASAAVSQHRVTGIPGCTWAANSGSGGGLGGFTGGRQRFEEAFQGANPFNGPYPLDEVSWANTAPFQTCDGNTVASDGNVAIIRPKDSFGYNDDWVNFSDNPSSNDQQNPLKLSQAQGTTVARYAINWATVGLSGSVPVTPPNCLQMGGNWGNTQPEETSYDRAYRYVTGRGPCDDTAPTTGIRPVLTVLGAPPPYARWCDESDDTLCGVGDCTSTYDRTPVPPPNDFTNPALPYTAPVGYEDADTAWKGFVQNVALRYPLARGIEIWNEPNLTKDYWGSCLPGPTRYAQLLGKADEGVAASGTGTPVVLAGMSPREQFTDNRRWTNYLNAVFAADPAVPTLFNVMGLHPYRSLQDRDVRHFGFGDAAADDVNDARDDVLAPNGIPLRTIWVTEVGATTADLDPDTGTEVQGAPAEREGNQATALGSIYYRLRNMVPVVIVHRLVDPPSGRAEGPGYGAVTREAAAPYPLDRRRPYYFEICQRRAITGGLCSQP